jgi:ABC-type arginine/histidine transport system permease subunit
MIFSSLLLLRLSFIFFFASFLDWVSVDIALPTIAIEIVWQVKAITIAIISTVKVITVWRLRVIKKKFHPKLYYIFGASILFSPTLHIFWFIYSIISLAGFRSLWPTFYKHMKFSRCKFNRFGWIALTAL